MDKQATNFALSGDLSNITTYHAGVIQAATHRTLQRLSDDVLRKYGITKMQWLIIGTVSDAGTSGMRITDLAELLGTNLSYLTNTINLLESKKILRRESHSTDSRAKLVYVEPKFIAKCQEIEEGLRKALRQSVYSHISPQDFQIYMKVMYQLAEIGMRQTRSEKN